MRTRIINICLLLMPPVMLLSRFGLSVLIILFVAASVFSREGLTRLKSVRHHYWNLSICLLFLLPLLSGFWSSDKTQWLQTIQVKLPLFFLPIGFVATGPIDRTWLRRIGWSFILSCLAAALWSLTVNFSARHEIAENYLRSTLMQTALSNDHVRFSWMIAIGVLVSALLYLEERVRIRKALLLISAVFLLIYLHLLAARTGLLAFYMAVISWLLVRAIRSRKALMAFWAICILFLPVLAYWILPTFRNRVRYVLYDFGFFSKAHYATGMNDAVRVISWHAGWDTWLQFPWLGTGWGDLPAVLKAWYQQQYPAMLPGEYILPGNDLLVYLAATGVAGGLLILLVLVIPFMLKKQGPGLLIGACLPALLLFDAALEVQYGVFLFCFVTLLAQSWVQSGEQEADSFVN